MEDLSPRSGGTKKFFGVPNFVLGIAHNETYARGRLARRINPEICVAVDGVIFNTNELADEFNVSSQTGLDPLVQLYSLLGVEFIPKLNGHFAIVVWDGANQRLILARDAIGSKPLYYAVSESKVVLASEIRGFRAFDGFRFKPDSKRLIIISRIHTQYPRERLLSI